MTTTIPDGLAVCPAWCVDCDLDTDGSSYHRGPWVELLRDVQVQAFAWQELGGPPDAPTFTVSTGDSEYTLEEMRRMAGALVEYAARF